MKPFVNFIILESAEGEKVRKSLKEAVTKSLKKDPETWGSIVEKIIIKNNLNAEQEALLKGHFERWSGKDLIS